MADSNSIITALFSAQKALAPAASDGADVTGAGTWRGLYYGGAAAADIAVILAGDTDPVTFKNVQPGSLLPLSVKRYRTTNTTAAANTVVLVG